jgi:hypothetical protein
MCVGERPVRKMSADILRLEWGWKGVVRSRNVRRGWLCDVRENKYRLNMEGMEILGRIGGV